MILFRAPRRGTPGLRERSSNSGLSSIRFGSDEWLYGKERRGAKRGAREGGEEVAEGRLHVVTQVGDAFEREYPRVRVIANYGRHLLVDLPAATAERIAASRDLCFRVEPVRGDVEVFRVAKPETATRRAGTAQAFVDAVTKSELEATVKALAAFNTRHSTSTTFVKAVELAEQRLRAAGYTPARANVKVGSKNSLNVIAEKRGGAANAKVLIVAAHLDSVNLAGSSAKAPGADDNASGAAGVLEIARALSTSTTDHDVRFILFGGEEQGLFGSKQYVASLSPAERQRIAAVVNMDMIGTRNGTTRGVLIEGADVSQAVIDALSAAAATYTTLEVTTSLNPFNSDHVPFIDAGIPAVLTIEAGDSSNSNIHGPNDTIDKIDSDLLTAIVRMNTGFIAERAVARKEEPMPDTTIAVAATGKLSGRYDFNGGVPVLSGRGFVDRGGNRRAGLSDPSHALDAPIFLNARNTGTRLTLHIDVDGPDPLNVVSGSVADGDTERHFIGRATQTITPAGVRIAVQDFSFKWPNTTRSVTKAEIEVTESSLTGIVATAKFTGGSQSFGPFSAKKVSSWFREVEVDVDREVGCAEVEPVSTHIHPDRPTDIAVEDLTLESAFAKAGIRITRATDSAVEVPEAAGDHKWTDQELHDSMVLHWQAFANRPQWKMWVFLGNRHDDDNTGGVMFDGDIDEPGGVDRQGTALFTRCPLFHSAEGDYITANPPFDEAIKRELFFNLIHETGHAFNLAHSFQKTLSMGSTWNAPSWAPVESNRQALSWLNYPDQATPNGNGSFNASWFYKRFRFRFDDDELLFLRHAPAADVQMGAQAWFDHHGRVARETVDSRLRLQIRHRKQIAELGEPILCELKLENTSGQPVTINRNLDPSEGYVQIAVTSPSGRRRPYIPVAQARRSVGTIELQPGKSIYEAVDLTMGIYGFPFKEPGPYRIEASYTNLDGSTAAAIAQIYVRPAASYDAVPIVHDLFRADVGRVLICAGTEVLDEVNDRLMSAERKLADAIGPNNPMAVHLRTTRYQPLARQTAIIDPDGKARRTSYDPDRFCGEMVGTLVGDVQRAADTMGHIWFRDVVDQYTAAAIATNKYDRAYQAQNVMYAMFKERGVVGDVLATIAARTEELKKMATKSVPARRQMLHARP
jgi:Peptidase family M28